MDAGAGPGAGPGAPETTSTAGHGAAYGGHGSGNSKIYGDRALDNLLGGSSGGSTATEGSGAGGGALWLKSAREILIKPNTVLSANGGNGAGDGASGAGGGIRLEGIRVYNYGRIEAKAGVGVKEYNQSQTRGSSGGRVSMVALGEVFFIPSATCLMIFKLIPSQSSLVIPGFLGTPAVIMTTSEFFVSS